MYKKTAKTLDFSGFSGMDLRGIEPLSEIKGSPIGTPDDRLAASVAS